MKRTYTGEGCQAQIEINEIGICPFVVYLDVSPRKKFYANDEDEAWEIAEDIVEAWEKKSNDTKKDNYMEIW